MKRASDNLSNARLETLLNCLEDGIMITDNAGNILYLNEPCSEFLGSSVDDLTGMNILEKLSDCPISDVFKNGVPVSGERYHFNNYAKECTYNIIPVFRDHIFGGVIGIFKQTAEIGKLMQELKRSTSIIEGIYERIADLNGYTDYTNSDVIPIDRMEQVLLRQALTKYGYSVEGKKMAAKALNISLATLYNKLKKYQIS